jgi:hypothetical protein
LSSRLPATLIVISFVAACGNSARPSAPAGPAAAWAVPEGWKHEVIPFPLGFAPGLAHRGVEELRFPPGFLDEGAPNRWSYTFVWRLEDAAELDEEALAAELTEYFRGLLVAVDGDQQRITPEDVVARAKADGDHFAISAHIIDTFRSAQPVDLVGTARRTACGTGALWTFVLAPEGSPIRGALDALAATAACDQPVVEQHHQLL